MRALEMIIKIGTVIEPQILYEYIMPILISMSTPSWGLSQNNLSAQAVSILI